MSITEEMSEIIRDFVQDEEKFGELTSEIYNKLSDDGSKTLHIGDLVESMKLMCKKLKVNAPSKEEN